VFFGFLLLVVIRGNSEKLQASKTLDFQGFHEHESSKSLAQFEFSIVLEKGVYLEKG